MVQLNILRLHTLLDLFMGALVVVVSKAMTHSHACMHLQQDQ
jgi:hypothetical protein